MLTLFGFVLVLGIVVDDAIIVGENIYRHQEEEHGEGSARPGYPDSMTGGYVDFARGRGNGSRKPPAL